MHECVHTQRNKLKYKVQAGSASFTTESLLVFLDYLARVL